MSVRIEVGEYRRLRAYFLDLACRRSIEALAGEFASVRLQPYAPVRVQLLNIWRAVNRERRGAGYEPVPIEAVPWKRRIVRPFGVSPLAQTGSCCNDCQGLPGLDGKISVANFDKV